jgi:acetolactate synthase small subunit
MSSSLPVAANASETFSAPAYFVVHARAEPGVMPRVIELFAKRGLLPGSWQSVVSGAALSIEIRIGELDRYTVEYIARCLRQIVGVDTVLTASD